MFYSSTERQKVVHLDKVLLDLMVDGCRATGGGICVYVSMCENRRSTAVQTSRKDKIRYFRHILVIFFTL